MKQKFIQTNSNEVLSTFAEHSDGEEVNVTAIGIIRHRSQLKKVIDDIAWKIQGQDETYQVVSEPYRRAMFLMNSCDESAMLGQFEKAASCSTEAARLFPYLVEALRGIADSYFSLSKYSDAITAYNHLISLYPNLPDVHYQLGRSLFETGKLDDAIEQFHREMEISGEAADIYLQIGSIHYSCAMDVFNHLYDSGERRPSFIFSKCGDRLEKARAAFETGIRLEPKSDELRQLLQQVNKILNSLR